MQERGPRLHFGDLALNCVEKSIFDCIIPTFNLIHSRRGDTYLGTVLCTQYPSAIISLNYQSAHSSCLCETFFSTPGRERDLALAQLPIPLPRLPTSTRISRLPFLGLLTHRAKVLSASPFLLPSAHHQYPVQLLNRLFVCVSHPIVSSPSHEYTHLSYLNQHSTRLICNPASTPDILIAALRHKDEYHPDFQKLHSAWQAGQSCEPCPSRSHTGPCAAATISRRATSDK